MSLLVMCRVDTLTRAHLRNMTLRCGRRPRQERGTFVVSLSGVDLLGLLVDLFLDTHIPSQRSALSHSSLAKMWLMSWANLTSRFNHALEINQERAIAT